MICKWSIIPYRPEVDGLAMPFLVRYFWSDITQTSCEGRELLPSGIKVLGTGRSCDTHVRGVSGEQVNATYVPKSAITISDDGSFVWERMFSGLSTGYLSDPKISQRGMKKGGEPRT
jgi:hypothetical protein